MTSQGKEFREKHEAPAFVGSAVLISARPDDDNVVHHVWPGIIGGISGDDVLIVDIYQSYSAKTRVFVRAGRDTITYLDPLLLDIASRDMLTDAARDAELRRMASDLGYRQRVIDHVVGEAKKETQR